MKKEKQDEQVFEDIGYKVKTSVFEGPFQLLLELVEKRKLFINEISLAQVTEDYINYIKSSREERRASNAVENKEVNEVDFQNTTDFIVIAATLILIKSRSLLPGLQLTTEEEKGIVDLEARLNLYKIISDISPWIKQNFGKKIIFPRGEIKNVEPIFSPDASITAENLKEAILGAFERIPKKEFLPKVSVRKVINIEEMISGLTERISKGIQMKWSDFAKGHPAENQKEAKVYAIVSFLAMLELVREGILDALQDGNFGEIVMQKQEENNLQEIYE